MRPPGFPGLVTLYDCVEKRAYLPVFRTTSNGLASGNTTAEALVHGLCEVMERDATWRAGQARSDATRAVVPSTVYPRLLRRALHRFEHTGMEPRIVDTSGPTGLLCFDVAVGDPDEPWVYGGFGCHPSRSTALLRTLTEAAQKHRCSKDRNTGLERDHVPGRGGCRSGRPRVPNSAPANGTTGRGLGFWPLY